MFNEAEASPRIQRKRRARKERILEVATDLIAEHGIEGLTVQRLAAALDYTPGALYRYFASKDAVIGALQRNAIEIVHTTLMRDRARRSTLDVEPRIAALTELLGIARGYVESIETRPQHLHLISMLLADPRRLVPDAEAAITGAALTALLSDVDAVFTIASECGALEPGASRRRTVMYWSALQGAVQMGKLSPFSPSLFDPISLGAEIARSLLIGWGADRAAIECAENLLERMSDAGLSD